MHVTNISSGSLLLCVVKEAKEANGFSRLDTAQVVADQGSTEASQTAKLSNQQILDSLQQAYRADGSGMRFWEVARSHR